jgi:hypothetical protein
MKTFCFECKHDCHCGRKCDQCSCYICNNIVIKTYEDYMGGNMISKYKDKFMVWQLHYRTEIICFVAGFILGVIIV